MLTLVYFSNVSENTHRFIDRFYKHMLETHAVTPRTIRIPLKEQIMVDEDYILVSPSYGSERNGHVPHQVKKFLSVPHNRNHCVGVVGTGNINFGDEYARSGEVLSAKLQVPLLHKFELSGFDPDIKMMEKLVALNRNKINEIVNQTQNKERTQA